MASNAQTRRLRGRGDGLSHTGERRRRFAAATAAASTAAPPPAAPGFASAATAVAASGAPAAAATAPAAARASARAAAAAADAPVRALAAPGGGARARHADVAVVTLRTRTDSGAAAELADRHRQNRRLGAGGDPGVEAGTQCRASCVGDPRHGSPQCAARGHHDRLPPRRAGRRRFTVLRVFPTCERVGVFHVRAHAGVNRVRFRGRLRGRPLPEGTYRLLVRARGAGAGADAATVSIVVVDGRPLSRPQLRAARRANVCGATNTGQTEASPAASSPSRGQPATRSSRDRAEGPIVRAARKAGGRAKSLGEHFARAMDDSDSVPTLVGLALALSALLLALALVPSAAFGLAHAEALAYRRFELALAGTGALAFAVLLVLIS